MLTGRGVGPLARLAGPGEADEERAAASAVEVAADPVAALSAAVGQIPPAHLLGARGKRIGDDGCGRRVVLHMGHPSSHAGCPISASLFLRPATPDRMRGRRWVGGVKPGRGGLRFYSKKGDRRRSAGPRGGRNDEGEPPRTGCRRRGPTGPRPVRRRCRPPRPGRAASGRCRSACPGTAPDRPAPEGSRSRTGRRPRRPSSTGGSEACRRRRPAGPWWRASRSCVKEID